LRSGCCFRQCAVRDTRREHRPVLLDPEVALSRNVSRKHAMEMLLTGDMISANQAYHMGLVNRVMRHETLESRGTMALAQQIASKRARR